MPSVGVRQELSLQYRVHNGANAEEQYAYSLLIIMPQGRREDTKKANIHATDGKRARPRDTVQPLATDLGLTVDTSCDRDDPDCVKKTVEGYKGPGNILICWQHGALTDIVETLGDEHAPEYPDERCDRSIVLKLEIEFGG